MRTKFVACFCFQLVTFTASTVFAQTVSAPAAVASAALKYSVVRAGPHYRVWEAADSGTNTSTQSITLSAAASRPRQPRHRVVEVASGLNYWDGQQWSPSEPSFQIVGNGFAASKLYQKVRLEAQLNTVGAVSTAVSNGPALTSTPVAIALYDPVSGQSVILGAITNCQGSLVSSNQIVYENAFSGSVVADVVYTLRRDALEQDVVLRTAVNPGDYGLSDKSRIQILTEFYGAPAPQTVQHPISIEQDPAVRGQMASPDFIDDTLRFGEMTFGTGRAYFAPKGLTNAAAIAPVGKDFFTTPDGRTFLRESVRCSDVKRGLQALPGGGTHALLRSPKHGNETLYAALPRAQATARKRALSPAPQRVAKLSPSKRPGLVIDYVEITGDYDTFIFCGDTTYFVSGPADFSDTVTIEGGAVLKYAPDAYIQINGDFVLDTSSYRPAVCTAADDDTIGESMNGIYPDYTGDPTGSSYASPALWFPSSSVSLNDVRFCYAAAAVEADLVSDIGVSDAQFVDCVVGLVLTGSGCDIRVNNCLFANVPTALEDEGYSSTWALCNCTIDDSSETIMDGGSSSLACTNCVVSNSGDAECDDVGGDHNAFYEADAFGNNQVSCPSAPFQTVGGGSYYLADDSPLRDAGITNLDLGLLADLARKTTYPPIVYSNATISVDTTFSPQAQRDMDQPDLGYHYDPIDYAFGGVEADANLTFTAGTVAGYFGTGSPGYHTGQSIHLGDTKTASFQGTAQAPDYWARYYTVQEGCNGNWTYGYGETASITGWALSNDDAPIVNLRFTRCSEASYGSRFTGDDYGQIITRAQDCEFYGAGFGGWVVTVAFTNCLLDRSSVVLNGGVSPNQVTLQNCTMRGSVLSIDRWPEDWGSPGTGLVPVTIVNSAFDGTSISTSDAQSDNTNLTYMDFNAFLYGDDQTYPTGSSIQVVTTFNWQVSVLGNYYLPSDSPLIDAGNTTADLVGLYHYTTQTNFVDGLQVIEGTSQVDIGYHYVAVDSNGNPIDTDGDGIPDYIEDANGNGLVDSGETDWQSATDLGLKVVITRPRNGSILP